MKLAEIFFDIDMNGSIKLSYCHRILYKCKEVIYLCSCYQNAPLCSLDNNVKFENNTDVCLVMTFLILSNWSYEKQTE